MRAFDSVDLAVLQGFRRFKTYTFAANLGYRLWLHEGRLLFVNKMKKLWSSLILLLFLTSGSVFAQACSKITLTGPPAAAPSSWVSEGKLIGAAVEFAEQISRAAGIANVEIRPYPTWRDALAAVYRGEVDVLFSANWSEERERYLDFVRPAMSSQFLYVVVRRGEAFELTKLEQLTRFSGAAGAGETYGDGVFGQFVRNNLQLTRAPSIDKVIDLLIEKKVDYIFGYENAVYEQMMVRNLGSTLQILNTYPTRAEGFLAFSKRSKCGVDVREKFAEQLTLAHTMRRYPALLTKYREVFNESLTRPR
jgi:polar amino acid transport system substrate-binding protein